MKKIFLYVSIIFSFLSAEVPNSISFQGYVTNVDGEPLTTGGYYLEFSIYDSETDGIVYWSESNWEFIEDNGLISLVLGSDDNPLIIPEDGVAYLGISIQNEPLGNRFKISSVPYYMQSGLADTANDSFVSEDINEEIHKLNKFKQLILLTNKSKITINIHYSYEDISKFVDIIVNALCFIFNLSIHNVYNCTINYYFTDNKKKLSLDKDYLNDYITKNEVNSGSCSSDTINIWRKE